MSAHPLPEVDHAQYAYYQQQDQNHKEKDGKSGRRFVCVYEVLFLFQIKDFEVFIGLDTGTFGRVGIVAFRAGRDAFTVKHNQARLAESANSDITEVTHIAARLLTFCAPVVILLRHYRSQWTIFHALASVVESGFAAPVAAEAVISTADAGEAW